MREIKDYIESLQKMLPVGTSISFTEAERRAGIFLEGMAKLTDWRHILSGEKIKLLSTQSAVYAEQMSKATDKTVTEKKTTVEASREYTKARENLEEIDNDLAYLKAYYEIFQNGHLFYRKMAAGDNV